MGGITIMGGKHRLRLIEGGVVGEEPEEKPSVSRLVDDSREYNLAAEALRQMEIDEERQRNRSKLNFLNPKRIRAAKEAQDLNEVVQRINIQRDCVNEFGDQLASSAMVELCMRKNSDLVFEALFQQLGGKNYGDILEKLMQKMIHKLMEQEEITELSNELAKRVGSILEFDETGSSGLSGGLLVAIAKNIERNLALIAGSKFSYTTSVIRRLMLKDPQTQNPISPSRMRFAETEQIIEKLVQLLTGQ